MPRERDGMRRAGARGDRKGCESAARRGENAPRTAPMRVAGEKAGNAGAANALYIDGVSK